MHHVVDSNPFNTYVSTHKLAAAHEIITYTWRTWTKLTFMLTPLTDLGNWWSSISSPFWVWFWFILSFSHQRTNYFRFALVRDTMKEEGCLNPRAIPQQNTHWRKHSIGQDKQKLIKAEKVQTSKMRCGIVLVLGSRCTTPNCISTVRNTVPEKVGTQT
jgi:hypothetical protein